jgi:carboxyl-terminal processing protease
LWLVISVFCFCVTVFVGVFFVTNYQEIMKIVQVATLIKMEYLEEVSYQQLLGGVVRGMVDSLNDPYSVYLEKEEYEKFAEHLQGAIGGIGVAVGVEEENFVVFSVYAGTPAEKVGLQKGDILYKVNDKYVRDMDLDEAVNHMRGDPGTKVRISVLRDGVLKEFEIMRDVINLPTIASEVLTGEEFPIGYMKLALFAINSDEAMNDHLDKLLTQKVKGLILDLRDNPGGDLQSCVNIARYFLPQGAILHTVRKNNIVATIRNDNSDRIELPLVVLINGGSASAAEILAGAIQDHQSGTIVGEKSFGKATVQELLRLRDGDVVKLTHAKYLTPHMKDLQADGVHPDIEVLLTAEDEEDKQLLKAVEVLKEKIAGEKDVSDN